MDRRRFLSSCGRLLGAGFALPAARALAGETAARPDSAEAAGFPDIVVARGDAKGATRAALEALGGMHRFVRPDQVVVVKPNAGFASPPEWGATTHPEVLAAVVEACFDAGARRVLVADHTMQGPERCFQTSGIADAVAAFPKAKLLSLDDEKTYRTIQVPAGRALRETEIPALMQKADVFVNVPTAKSHAATGVSLGLKNLMGLVWDRHRFHQEMDLHMGIADLATVLRPRLTVLDAMRILETGGPTGPGEVTAFGAVIAGVDPVAVDAYGVGISAWNGRTLGPDEVAHIRYASEHGLGTTELDALRVEELG